MKQIVIFGGTTEGRILAEALSKCHMECCVCVATEYGEQVLEELPLVRIHRGRMNQSEMEEFILANQFEIIVDATHPFAIEVSKNVKSVSMKTGIGYIRLTRRTGVANNTANLLHFTNNQECAAYLARESGKVFLTIGSKEISAYTSDESLRKRLLVRILPAKESFLSCYENGMEGKQMIAMQGPFSEQMNRLQLKENGISFLVTKEGGRVSGYYEKLIAAQKENVTVCLVGAPKEEDGLSFEDAVLELENRLGVPIQEQLGQEIAIVSIGMGKAEQRTLQANKVLAQADVIFGAKRVLECIESNAIKKPYYLGQDIIPMIKEHREYRKIVIAFSGDCGFYSGSKKMISLLRDELEMNQEKFQISVIPGISSISYLAAKLNISWEDAKIASIHGREDDILSMIKYHKKVFVLLSGKDDLMKLCSSLKDHHMNAMEILVGYNLSYENEKVFTISNHCIPISLEDGLYACFIVNHLWEEKILTPALEDKAFIRDKVPMTKEEIRMLSLCKLKLSENAVVYDIGSGTGSIAVECARLSPSIKVYAIEKNKEAILLMKRNFTQFQTSNIQIVETIAPNGLEHLAVPTHVFIGGSSGNLKEILCFIKQRNRKAHVVVNAISLETIQETMEAIEKLQPGNVSIVQIQVNRASEVGRYHLLKAENPVMIFSIDF